MTSDEIVDYFVNLGFKIHVQKTNSKSVFVIAKEGDDRNALMAEFTEKLGGVWISDPISVSSIGFIHVQSKNGPIRVFIKPHGRQGRGSAGIANEFFLVDMLRRFLGPKPIHIEFKCAATTMLFPNVVSVSHVGKTTKARSKSDVELQSLDGSQYHISIKQRSAHFYESADSFWGHTAAKVIDYTINVGDIEVNWHGPVAKLSRRLGIPATEEESRNVVFGSDIEGQGCVAIQTFAKNHFTFDGQRAIVQCEHILRDMNDLHSGYEVMFLIRADATRRSIPGFPGIRVLAAKESALSSTVLRVPRIS